MPRGGRRLRTEDGRMNKVGLRARERRQELGIGQDELCARIAAVTKGGWNPGWQDISRIEGGTRIVSDLETFALADALACSSCWLIAGEGSA